MISGEAVAAPEDFWCSDSACWACVPTWISTCTRCRDGGPTFAELIQRVVFPLSNQMIQEGRVVHELFLIFIFGEGWPGNLFVALLFTIVNLIFLITLTNYFCWPACWPPCHQSHLYSTSQVPVLAHTLKHATASLRNLRQLSIARKILSELSPGAPGFPLHLLFKMSCPLWNLTCSLSTLFS